MLINIPGQAQSGRYVIVQMDNGEDTPLNLKEVTAFGKWQIPRHTFSVFRFFSQLLLWAAVLNHILNALKSDLIC